MNPNNSEPRKATLREVHELIASGKRVSVETPDGFQPVLYFHKTPSQEVFRINDQPFALTAEHKIYDTLGNPIELRNVRPDSWIKGTDGKPFHVTSIVSEGIQETCDLTIDHDSHRYILGNVVVSNCLHSRSASCTFCGHCFDKETTQVDAWFEGEEEPDTLTLNQLEVRIQNIPLEELPKRVSIHVGHAVYKPLKAFHNNGLRPMMRVNGRLWSTETHQFVDENMNKVPMHILEQTNGKIWINGELADIDVDFSQGIHRPVADLEIDSDEHVYLANGILVSNCNSPAEVKHVSGAKRMAERGADMIPLIEKENRDNQIAQRILFEVVNEGGIYSSIDPAWMHHALNRAVMQAGWRMNTPIVDSLIYEKRNNTRMLYRIKDENFKSLVSGKTVYELNFNSKVVFNEELVQSLVDLMNKEITKGWRIATGKIVSSDFVLKNFFKYQLVTFRLDSRKVSEDFSSLKYMQDCIEHFKKKGSKYRKQVRVSQQEVRSETIQYTSDRVTFLKAGYGRTPTEIVLRVMMEVEESHPLIWLAGFLAKGDRPKSYATLSSAEIKVEGFYEVVKQLEGSLFDTIKSSSSSKCPKCSGLRAVNIMSALPFGTLPEEQNPLLLSKYGQVCQECWAEEQD